MTRRIFKILRYLACVLALAPAHAQDGNAPFPGVEEDVLNPMASLFTGNQSYEYGLFDPGTGQQWDASAGHYRGTGLRKLHYPRIPRAGYLSFTLEDGRDFGQRQPLGTDDPAYVLQQGAYAMARNPGRVRRAYTLDDSGWVRSVHVTRMDPEYGFYLELRDSFFYERLPGGNLEITWRRLLKESSDARHHSSAECRPAGERTILRQSCEVVAWLDRWENLTAIQQRWQKTRDTCKVQVLQTQSRIFSYDSIGRLVRSADSSSGAPGIARAVAISYDDKPYAEFSARVSQHYLYAPLREGPVDVWLRRQPGLSAVLQHRRSTEYWVYDQNLRTSIYRPDSPAVRIDTSFFILDAKRERVVSRVFRPQAPFEFYMTMTGARPGSSVLWVQQLAAPPDPDQGPVTVCEPLAISDSKFYALQTGTLGKDTVRKFSNQASRGIAYHSDATPKQPKFSAEFPADLKPHGLQGMELRDARGLTTWLWLHDQCYKLTYP